MTERNLPQSLEAEMATLGACLMERDAVASAMETLSGHSFYRESHRALWDVLVKHYDAGLPVDIITIGESLKKQGKLEELGGAEYLSALLYQCPTAANIRAYVKPVDDAAAMREMIREVDAFQRKLFEAGGDPDILTAELAAMAERAERRRTPSVALREYDDILVEVLQDFEKRKAGQIIGTPTGFTELDDVINGLRPTRLYIVAARPGVGKSAFAENVAEYVGRNSGKTVLVFSLEMTAEQLVERDIAGEAKIDTRHLERGHLSIKEWAEVGEAAERMWGTKIIIEDATDLNLSRMRAVARAAESKYGNLGLIVVDYLQIVDTDDMKNMSRVQEVTELAKGLRKIAKERKVPVMALCQTSRECEKREDKRGQLSDLRESGGIEAEAHTVIFLYRDSDYRPHIDGAVVDNTTELILRKNRGGPKTTVKLLFVPEHARFRNLTKWGAEQSY